MNRRYLAHPSSLIPSKAVGVVRFPARRDADVGQAEQALDRGPLADVVALRQVADPLQQVADDERRQRPVPLVGKEQQEGQAGDRQRDAEEVDVEVERQLVAQPPALQAPAQEVTQGAARRRVHESSSMCRLRLSEQRSAASGSPILPNRALIPTPQVGNLGNLCKKTLDMRKMTPVNCHNLSRID